MTTTKRKAKTTKSAAKKATVKTSKKANAARAMKPGLTDSSVVTKRAAPVLKSRQAIAKLIPKAGIKVSDLVKKAVKANVNARGETTAEFVRNHIQGAYKAGKIGLKE